jgi:hypothetical protein
MGVGFGGRVTGLIVPVAFGWKAAGIKARAAGFTRRDIGGEQKEKHPTTNIEHSTSGVTARNGGDVRGWMLDVFSCS